MGDTVPVAAGTLVVGLVNLSLLLPITAAEADGVEPQSTLQAIATIVERL